MRCAASFVACNISTTTTTTTTTVSQYCGGTCKDGNTTTSHININNNQYQQQQSQSRSLLLAAPSRRPPARARMASPELNDALLAAAAQGSLADIQSLLDRQADVNARAADQSTPLHLATSNGHLQCIELLLDHRANVNARSADYSTPLHLAANNGHHQCIEPLLDRGASINARDSADDTPLHRAAKRAHNRCVELLLDRGANKLLYNVCGLTLHTWLAPFSLYRIAEPRRHSRSKQPRYNHCGSDPQSQYVHSIDQSIITPADLTTDCCRSFVCVGIWHCIEPPRRVSMAN